MAGRVTRSRQGLTQQTESQPRARWTNGLTKIFADLMVDQVQQGNKLSNNAFNRKAWMVMCDEFYQKTGLRWDKEQLKNRFSVMKRQHSIVKSLLSRREFHLDASTGNIIARNEVWNEYIKEHPDAEPIRGSGCPIYKQLGVIFSEPLTSNGKNREEEESAEPEEEIPSSVPFEETFSTMPLNIIQEEEEEESSESEAGDDDQEMLHKIGHKRGRKGIDDAIAGAILNMAAASRLRTSAVMRISERYSVADCIKELDTMQGVEEGVYFAALDLFDNPNAREIFLSLKGDKRMVWLRGKCAAHLISQV